MPLLPRVLATAALITTLCLAPAASAQDAGVAPAGGAGSPPPGDTSGGEAATPPASNPGADTEAAGIPPAVSDLAASPGDEAVAAPEDLAAVPSGDPDAAPGGEPGAAPAGEPGAAPDGEAAATDPVEDDEAADAVAGPTAGYRGGFFIRAPDGPFELRVQGRVQARYTLTVLDDRLSPRQDESYFSIQRARLSLAGHAFTNALAYKLEFDFGKGFVTLKDYFVNYTIVSDWLELRVGQFKRPFSRQQINSSGRLGLVDRAITDSFFGGGRDIGIMVHNDYEHSPTFEYALGIFNGTGDRPRLSGDVTVTLDPMGRDTGTIDSGSFSNVPDRFHPMFVARVGYNHAGIQGYREADLEGGDLRFAVGASGLVDLDLDDDGRSFVRAEADFALKVHGLSSVGGVYVSSRQSVLAGTSFGKRVLEAVGFHLQVGYVIAGAVQPTVRYSHIAVDGDDNDRQEIRGGLAWYMFDHGLKWQTDVGALITDSPGGSSTDIVVRSQLQLAF